MAKYAYAPVSVDQNRRHPHDGSSNDRDEDNLVHERMPMCVGICVLLAIVFVLSRAGDTESLSNPAAGSMRASGPPHTGSSIPEGTAPMINGMNANANANANTNYYGAQQNTNQQYPMMNNNQIPNTQSNVYPPPQVNANQTPQQYNTMTNSAPQQPQGPPTQPQQQQQQYTMPAEVQQQPADCDCPTLNDTGDLMGQLREKALQNTPPHIIECDKAADGENQAACHLPSKERYASLGQKGATIWMTGCSGAGKTTIATALEDKLVKEHGKHVYRLDGDNLRTGINRDLTFSASDRAESVRRTGELAALFSDSGVITLVGLISPYIADRDAARKRHEDQGIPFYEVFLDVPVDELKKRDPKGQYARVESGELKHFTCIDDPYEAPMHPELILKTHELKIEESVEILFRQLERDGILIGAPKVTPPGLPNPDGDEIIDLIVPEHLQTAKKAEAMTLPKVLLTDIDVNWLQTIGEGWAAPLKGFMREGTLLETIHFNSILVDPFNVTGSKDRLDSITDFANFPPTTPRDRVSMSVPITLAITEFTKKSIEDSGLLDVALTNRMGKTLAIMRNIEIYPNRKEEIVARTYGVIDMGHPYIHNIYMGGDFLIGGEIELLERIRYNDGLDKWRKTAKELMDEFEQKGADTVYAFQTRNPTHAGHAYLMRSAGEDLKSQGYRNPVLWLSPLGGWTKSDDVPLDVRVKQHEYVLEAGTSHPGGLDPETTVMAIWPSPMIYAGPTEVEFHAKSRRSAGASYFVVGRDPAGMKGSSIAVAHPDDDLYDGDHGRYVLQNSPGIGDMKMLSFVKVMYDITDNVMKVPDKSRMDDFISISGTKMRALARQGAVPCPLHNIPTDLLSANCIPAGFMVPKGWQQVVDYYKNIDETDRWIPWSRQFMEPPADAMTSFVGRMGSSDFHLSSTKYNSFWHDVPMRPKEHASDPTIINLVTEIPMFMAAKMELNKDYPHNAIGQDINSDGTPRYYTYGSPFFNYGFISQTWEDPSVMSEEGHFGDNDPLDVIELGSGPLKMGSITPCRVIGSLELIDQGETDYKILCIALSDPDAHKIYSTNDLDHVKPGHTNKLKTWLKRYKTSSGKAENTLASEIPKTATEALSIITETHERWEMLCGKDGTHRANLPIQSETFWLDSPSCRGSSTP